MQSTPAYGTEDRPQRIWGADKKMNDHNNESLTFVDLALALANDYSSIYVINTEDDSYVEYTPSGDNKELTVASKGEDFYADTIVNCRRLVWPEDQEMFVDALRKENIKGSLDAGKSFSINYRLVINGKPRYFFLKTIRGSDRSIIIGVRDVDTAKRRELAAASQSITNAEIAQSLASMFEVIYHIDTETGTYTEYMSSETYERLGLRHEGSDFFKKAVSDINSFIHPDDRDMVNANISRDSLIPKLRENGSFSLTYRQVLDDRTQYVNLLAFLRQNDSEHIVMAVRNIDKQIRQENESLTYSNIAAALASLYDVIYYINIDTDDYSLYRWSSNYFTADTIMQGKDYFTVSAGILRQFVHTHDLPWMLKEMTKDNILKRLETEKTFSYTYRQLVNGEYLYMNLTVMRPQNDEHHIVMAMFNVDDQTRRIKTMEKQAQTFSDISLALALQYEVIYHVDLNTNEYSEYSASEKYSKLKVGTTGKDFFAETAENMKRDIYPEDYPMMAEAMKKDNLLESLGETGKTFLNYRLILDGRPQYVSLYAVRAEKDSDHIIVAVANVDKAKRMELNYHNAVDLANRDALTGVKNKRAYAQAEMELDEQIERGLINAFAVVICDINGLKEVNDTYGHKAGDDYIRSGCTVICDIFDHSPVFRIGGDEFAVIVRDRDYERRTDLIDRFIDLRTHHAAAGLVTIACGISEFHPGTDMRLQDVFERADTRMYEDKKRFKNG